MQNKVIIKSNERIDDLQRFGLKIIQSPDQFRFSTDAVLISEFANVKSEDVCIDLGTGTGVIPLLVYARRQPKKIIGVEIVPEMVDMATRSVEMNNLLDKIQIVEGNIKNVFNMFKKGSFDVVISNPPYIKSGTGSVSFDNKLALAKHEVACSLEDVVYSASKLLKTKGRFYMVHKPKRLCDIICCMSSLNITPVRLRFVQSYEKSDPIMVMIEGVKDVSGVLKVSTPLILYKEDGTYTEELSRIYYE